MHVEFRCSWRALRSSHFPHAVPAVDCMTSARCMARVEGGRLNTSGGPAESPAAGARLMLKKGWQVQTSSGQPEGEAISKTGFAASGWFATAIPASVSGVLANAGVYPDPFVGTNLRDWPGMGRGRRGSPTPGAPQSNPFSVAWWFRTEFDLPAEMAGKSNHAPPRRGQLPR